MAPKRERKKKGPPVQIEELGAKPKKTIARNSSNFWITINTNVKKKGSSRNPGMKRKFRDGVHKVLDNLPEHIKFLDHSKGSLSKIKSIKVETKPETGKKKGFIHMHILVKIKHNTKIQLNYSSLKAALVESGAVPASGFHFYVESIKDNISDLRDYMNKKHASSKGSKDDSLIDA